MGQFTITLPDELEKEVRESVRMGNYGSVSDFVRDAIKNELSHRPTYWERFIAAHTLENNKLLKQIVKDPNWGGDELLEALKSGYVGDYARAGELIYSDQLSIEGSEFVHQVLGMYAELQHAFNEHGEGDKTLAKEVLFEGFDGNAGDGYLGYVNFLVDNGRYTYVRPLDKIPHLNSHSIVNYVYRRMLDEFKVIKGSRQSYDRNPLSLEELKRVIAARIHPENRSLKTSNER